MYSVVIKTQYVRKFGDTECSNFKTSWFSFFQWALGPLEQPIFHNCTKIKFGAKMLIDAEIMAQNRIPRWRPSAILDFRKYDFWALGPHAIQPYQIFWFSVLQSALCFSLRLCFSNDVCTVPNSWRTTNRRNAFMAGWHWQKFRYRLAFTKGVKCKHINSVYACWNAIQWYEEDN